MDAEWEISKKRRKAEANIKIQEAKKEEIQQLVAKGLADSFKNTFLLKLFERSENQFYYNYLCHAMIHGPHLVFDFDFRKSNDR